MKINTGTNSVQKLLLTTVSFVVVHTLPIPPLANIILTHDQKGSRHLCLSLS